MKLFLIITSGAFAGIMVFILSKRFVLIYKKLAFQSKVISTNSKQDKEKLDFSSLIIEMMKKNSYNNSSLKHKRDQLSKSYDDNKYNNLLQKSGFEESINKQGILLTRRKLSFYFSFIGFLVGYVLSIELSIIMLIVGFIFGLVLPSQVLKNEIKRRIEYELCEMLDVVSICLRSGLSFDRSLKVYCSNFKTLLSDEMNICINTWNSGLKTREETLLDLSKSYDSVIFERCIDSILRALTLGSSIAECVCTCAKETRVSIRAKREEEVQKAPVKMMIPVGTLILPAMLILVLGPVILELGGGI